MSFDMQRHPEDFEEFEIYNSMEKYMEEIVAANKAFTSGIKQLIGYKNNYCLHRKSKKRQVH